MKITPAFLKRAAALALFAGFVYCNIAVILRPVAERWFPQSEAKLPLPGLLVDAFYLFGVFSYYEEFNQDVVIEVIPATRVQALVPDADGRPRRTDLPTQWCKLPLKEFFPFWRGDRLRRVYAYNNFGHPDSPHNEQKFKEVQQALAGKIKARYNRDHPELEVSKIRIVRWTWPRTSQRYDAAKIEGQIYYSIWHEE